MKLREAPFFILCRSDRDYFFGFVAVSHRLLSKTSLLATNFERGHAQGDFRRDFKGFSKVWGGLWGGVGAGGGAGGFASDPLKAPIPETDR